MRGNSAAQGSSRVRFPVVSRIFSEFSSVVRGCSLKKQDLLLGGYTGKWTAPSGAECRLNRHGACLKYGLTREASQGEDKIGMMHLLGRESCRWVNHEKKIYLPFYILTYSALHKLIRTYI